MMPLVFGFRDPGFDHSNGAPVTTRPLRNHSSLEKSSSRLLLLFSQLTREMLLDLLEQKHQKYQKSVKNPYIYIYHVIYVLYHIMRYNFSSETSGFSPWLWPPASPRASSSRLALTSLCLDSRPRENPEEWREYSMAISGT